MTQFGRPVTQANIALIVQAYDDVLREEGLKTGDKKQVFKYSSESDHATEMMDDLKDRVKQTENKVGTNACKIRDHTCYLCFVAPHE